MDWTDNQTWASLANPGSGGVDDTGYLRITLDQTDTEEGEPGAQWGVLVSVPVSSFFAGNWGPGMNVAFDFWAEDIEPDYMQVRWRSATNSSVWRATVFDSDSSSMPTGTWTSLSAPSFRSYLDWDFGGGNQEQFVNDLATIDWIGVFIWRNTADAQHYGIDNFRLMIPEPGQCVMFAAALLSSALSLRKRPAVAGLRARVRRLMRSPPA
jgi:hypothetical protein